MKKEEKQWLMRYIKTLIKAKYSDSEIVRQVELNGISKSTARNYLKSAKA